MKKYPVLIIAVMMAIISSCDGSHKKNFLFPFFKSGSSSSSTGQSGSTPSDVIQDESDTRDFNYQTLHDVSFDLKIFNEANTPLSQAVIRVSDDASDITSAVTSENGTAAFKISISNTIESITLTIDHPKCVSKTIVIDGIQDLATVTRTIYCESKPEPKELADRDKDGVPDDIDAFPDDPLLIGTVSNEYTIAFEDLYPQKGDADFNDLVIRLGIKEFIDNNNKISKIAITSKVLSAGAGYRNQFWISVLDNDYKLIEDPKTDLSGSWNDRAGENYVDGPVHTKVIIPPAPVARDAIEPMPYDPYILCNGVAANQVHLPFVKTKFTDAVVDNDNFPWAVVVPADWSWPYEQTSVFSAYPEFKPWYESKGNDYRDWYLHPEVDKVYKVSAGTILSAYILKMSTNSGIILGILILMVLASGAVTYVRKRRSHD